MNETNYSLDDCQKSIGYQFVTPTLLETALTHSSVAANRGVSNERLEFLGDAILGMIICHELFERFPNYLEGELTKIKSMIVSRRTCAKIAQELGMQEFLRIGKGMFSQAKLPLSCLAAVYESLIGAIYLDGGLESAKDFILRTMNSLLDEADADKHQENYKSILQQHAQREMETTPYYELLDEKGPDHSKCFEIAVVIGTQRFPGAWGPSKKEAEQQAALKALQKLNLLPGESVSAPPLAE